MKWNCLWLVLNLACVAHSLAQPALSPISLMNAFAVGMLGVAIALQWVERD